MKKLLLIILLIVGCDDFFEPEDVATQDEILDVAWVVADSLIYWTAGIDVITIDNEDYWYSIYMELIGIYGSDEGFQEWYSNTAYTHSYVFQNDTLQTGDSVRTISHFIEPNYFEIIGESRKLFPEDYDIFKYEYK